MTRHSPIRNREAFTRIELMVIVLTLGLLVGCAIPRRGIGKHRAMQLTCIGNLRIVGMSYRLWPSGSSDEHPQQVPVQYGGSKEWLIAGQVFLHFRTMSNELSTPKILVCPADKQRVVARSFGQGFSNTNISYFASLDAPEIYPQTFLSGDRNLAHAGTPIGSGTFILTTNSASSLSWTRQIHDSCGNVGLADGSVQMFAQAGLAAAVSNQGIATNRIVLP